MGMDVYGKNPSNGDGEYFRNSVWSWRPLATYCCEVAPEITSNCNYWHSNDGDGLNAQDSESLAAILQAEVESGRCAQYAKAYTQALADTPNEPCPICGGTGYRHEPPKVGAGDYPCNGCDETGMRRPFSTMYFFSVENVEEFIAFLEKCGGFEIW